MLMLPDIVHSAVGTSDADGGWVLSSSEAQNSFILRSKNPFLRQSKRERHLGVGKDDIGQW